MPKPPAEGSIRDQAAAEAGAAAVTAHVTEHKERDGHTDG